MFITCFKYACMQGGPEVEKIQFLGGQKSQTLSRFASVFQILSILLTKILASIPENCKCQDNRNIPLLAPV